MLLLVVLERPLWVINRHFTANQSMGGYATLRSHSDAPKETPPLGQGYSELLNPDPVHRPGRADTPILALEKIERAVRRLT